MMSSLEVFSLLTRSEVASSDWMKACVLREPDCARLTMDSEFTELQRAAVNAYMHDLLNQDFIETIYERIKRQQVTHDQREIVRLTKKEVEFDILSKKLEEERNSFGDERQLFEGKNTELSMKIVELEQKLNTEKEEFELHKSLSVSKVEKAELLIKVTDLEDSLSQERSLITSLKKDLQNEQDQMLKHSFGNAQNLKLVTSLRKENECLQIKVLELDEDKKVFKNKPISSQSRVMELSKQVTDFEQIVIIERSNFEKERKVFEEERSVFVNERKSFELKSEKFSQKISDLERKFVIERKEFEKKMNAIDSKTKSSKKPSFHVGKYNLHDFEEDTQVVQSEREVDEKKRIELHQQIVNLQNQLSDVRNQFKQKEKVFQHEKTVLEQIIAEPKKPSLVEKDFEDQKEAFKAEIKKLTSKLFVLLTDIMNEQQMRTDQQKKLNDILEERNKLSSKMKELETLVFNAHNSFPANVATRSNINSSGQIRSSNLFYDRRVDYSGTHRYSNGKFVWRVKGSNAKLDNAKSFASEPIVQKNKFFHDTSFGLWLLNKSVQDPIINVLYERYFWRSPDGAWSFFFKYQPPPSVLDMSFEVQYTRGVQRNESESTKGADTLRKSISDHLSLYFTADLLEPFEEPEREFRKRNKKKSKANKVRPRALIFEMGDEAPMWTARRAAPTVPTNPITKPNLNKEIPGKLLHMIKDLTFDGKNDSNPIVHMENFVDICDLFKTEADRDDAIRLRVFPLTLTGEARAWLRSLEPSSITTWEGLRSKFLSRFFPPSKIDKLRAEIRSFQQQDGETISEAWERFKHLLNSCPSHELNKSEQVQTFYSGLAYSSQATLDSSADRRTDKRLQIPRMAGKISTDFDPSDELAAMKNQQVKFERKIEELIKSVHALQVGCEECNGPHLTKDCPNKPMMTPEEVNYINRGDYQGRWNNNRNFIPRPPGFFAPTQQNQRSDGEPRVSIEDRIIQFMDAQKKLNDEVGRVSQMLSERTQGELPMQTLVNPKVENAKPMLMITGEPSKKKWTDIYTKKYVETESESEPDYATDYDSEGFTVSFEHLRLKVPEASSENKDEEDGKQGGYAEFMIPKKEDKGKEKEKEKEKAPEDDLIYIAPIKHDPGSYNLPISCHKFSGLALVDSGAALNMMPVCYCRKMGVKRIVPTNYQYRGVNGYMTTPLGIAEGVPIRIGKFVYYTDFVIANLPQNTEIPIILGRSFLHTAQVNTDMRNQVTSLGYGDNRIYFDPNEEPVRHLDEPYDDPSMAYTKSMNRPLLPHELGKKTEDYSNPMHKKEQSTKEPGTSKKDHRKKRGSSSRRAKK
ncbi:hypothetical protein OSB04_002942 [Centaurea solstitialis]|uniref:Retrotransposon gag domain-containing protein n=1 Tax=Centaurea solstitialis TaxID=347529 RepID=A0AA38WVI2_9ASTR|nr:hypothetical protein OSB04_002942 [Centaurea solstitialis]